MSTGRHIRVLSDEVANKIAAGEVVDRPASVLKELLENALDARATQIGVEIAAGGRKLIAVSDNGVGMNRDDALLSIERHATSKIRDVEDIEHIATLGFRGEALAAISSVARFSLQTCDAASPAGTLVLMSGGKLQDVREIGGPVGTAIEVRDLFFNVPARRKFLRSADTEMTHLRQVFLVHALAHPAVGMSLKVDGRPVYELAGGARLEDRIRDLFGPEYRRNLRPVDHSLAGVRVTGYAGLPASSRADRSEEFLFINGRAASAPVVGAAIRLGYQALMPRDRFPVLFLFLEMDSGMVDVNVHPTKREVRFRSPSDVREAVTEAIRHALASDAADITHAMGPAPIEHDASGRLGPDSSPPLIEIQDIPRMPSFKYPRLPMLPPESGRPEVGREPPDTVAAGATGPADSARAGAVEGAGSPWTWCRVLGQIGGLYVVLETEDGYVLMDPHAAHERVTFERYLAAVANHQVEIQGLLVPETLDLPHREADHLRRNVELLKHMGFGVAEFGGDSFVIDALPSFFMAGEPLAFLKAFAHNLEDESARDSRTRWTEEVVAQAACKASVKARDHLTLAEIEKLVVDLAGTTMPYTCPHGRPTLIFTSFRELSRKFGRT